MAQKISESVPISRRKRGMSSKTCKDGIQNTTRDRAIEGEKERRTIAIEMREETWVVEKGFFTKIITV